jgi:EAL domain-containing protein (putative c-di-GMP-specific phosphodiesterase class I)
MITLGRNLNLRVVAEGIETRRQLEFLTDHHCPEGQGYYFSRPVAADEFAVLLSRPFSMRPAFTSEALRSRAVREA